MEPYRQKVLQEKIGLWSVIALTSITAVIAVILLMFGDFQSIIIKRHVVAHYWLTQSESIDFSNRFLTLMQVATLGATFAGLIYVYCWYYIAPKLTGYSSSKTIYRSLSLSNSAFEILFLVTLLIVAITIRLYRIDRGLSYDELFTVIHFVDVHSIWITISSYVVFNNHIAYSILSYLSKTIFGRDEWAFRLPALLMGLISLCFFWYFICTFVDKKVATLATLTLAIMPTHVEWSTSARGYTGLLLFVLIASFAYLRLLREPSRHYWSIFVLASVAGIYIHLYALLVIAVQFILVLFLALKQSYFRQTRSYLGTESFRLIWSAFGIIVLLSFICYLPVSFKLTYWILRRVNGTFEISFPITVAELLSSSSGSTTLTALVFLLFVVGLIVFWRLHALEAVYLLFLVTIPLLAVWLSRPYDLYPRFFAYYLPFFIFLVSLGYFKFWDLITKQKNHFIRSIGSLICMLFLGYGLYFWGINSWFNIHDEGYRTAVHALTTNADTSVRLCAIGVEPELYQFYSEQHLVIPRSIEQVKQLDNSSPEIEIRCIYRKAYWESPVQTGIANFLLENAEVQQIGQFLIFRY